jgi:ammonia channel protein AmtB
MLSVKLMQTFYTLYYQQLSEKQKIETMWTLVISLGLFHVFWSSFCFSISNREIMIKQFHLAIMCEACMLIKQKPQVNAYACKERKRFNFPLGHFIEHQ